MSRPRQQHPTDSSGYAMTNQPTANRGNPVSGSGSPDSQQGRRVVHASTQSAEDAVVRSAVLADLHRLGTGGAPTTGGRVPHKQVHTHSVRDLREDMSDDEEGKMTRSSSRSPTVSVMEELPAAPRLGVGCSAHGDLGGGPGRLSLRRHDTQPSEGYTRGVLT
ncbi:hypothetical protein HPB52_006558 [Rhipicephalus sanguineus]|uniref:Uncharacterized protein n=1 Tax=Rhipicephalus sanguineus TaxID=34632 RepID=A0A9D4SQV4_RHISA|nr:hypothetical protein HPB52_006558 [Rhipicephalus sanguineus]